MNERKSGGMLDPVVRGDVESEGRSQDHYLSWGLGS